MKTSSARSEACGAEAIAAGRVAGATLAQPILSDAINSGKCRVRHRPEMVPLITKYSGVDAKALAAMPKMTLGTSLDPQLIQPMIDAAVKYKAIAAAFPVRDLFDPAVR